MFNFLIETRSPGIRVIHYDRNLGKGYAVKTGALAAHGEWVALVDADLDLDPASVPRFLAVAQQEQLDFAIGSKRHPDSRVAYPKFRRFQSWVYQVLVRILFNLNIRDTQTGLKLFRRDVLQEALPLLAIKKFAFDLELLVVAKYLGYGNICEAAISLDFQFDSTVNLRSAWRVLWDTAAIFYRLRILRYYESRRLQVAAAVADERLREVPPEG